MNYHKSTKSISNEIKTLVRENYSKGVTAANLAEIFKISRTSVWRIIKFSGDKKRGVKITYDLKKLLYQAKRAYLSIMRNGQRVTSRKIYNLISEKVSLRTLQKCLYDNKDFFYGTIPKRIVLNEEKRLKRVKYIKSWFCEKIEFKNIIYTDECRFSLDGPDHFKSWQLHSRDNVWERPSRANNGGSIMIYGAISYDGKLLIRKINEYLNGERYLNLLKEDIIPTLKQRYGNICLQQDNARPHTCKLVMSYLNQSEIKLLPWPPYSPDLSIIENAWKMLKDLVHSTPYFETKEHLWLKIRTAVTEFNYTKTGTIKRLYDGISDKYFDICMNGGYN